MWIFTPNAFLSVVAHRTKPKHVLVRARLPGDIEEVFPGAVVEKTPDADYLYRTVVTRVRFERAMLSLATEVTYPNVKGAVSMGHPTSRARLHAMHQAWSAMYSAQQEMEYPNGDLTRDMFAGDEEEELCLHLAEPGQCPYCDHGMEGAP
jgi:hypothetical protein